ncbi:MAG: type II toxin-antitoxin system RelE/ParE family toxin [Nitrospirae bacterium]|nr:type II toxin-antitoxin system RelE/ParE family toxin [Nitrospirota bacterium]
MTKKFALSFAESAIADLEAVGIWFKEQGAQEAGQKLISDVISQTERLSLFPDSGRVVPEFGVESLREIIYPPFRIVYRREEGRIIIVRIWRSERLLKLP